MHKGRRSELRKGRVSVAGGSYFLTKCLLDRGLDTFSRAGFAEILIDSFVWARDQGWYRLLGFVVMPDHYHLVIGLGERKPLDRVMQSLNRFTAGQVNEALDRSGMLWEEGYYDHLLRDRRDFDAVLEYVHNNPVEAGLVELQEDWPFSTANPRYMEFIDWEWLGPALPDVVKSEYRFDPGRIPGRYR
jgi:REP element-mobilizing transposase RayT